MVSDENMFENNDGSPISRSEMPFKMHKLYFSRKKYLKNIVATLPSIFRPALLPETHIFCYLAWFNTRKLKFDRDDKQVKANQGSSFDQTW